MSSKPESDATFGAQLRRLRIAAGLTQEALAERAGLSLNAVSALERGERRSPYPHTVQVLADALELSGTERAAFLDTLVRRFGGGVGPGAQRLTLNASIPEPATPLIGREANIAESIGMLRRPDIRMLTLTGPGGVGKTRLAVGIASGMESAFADGVAFVSLASIVEPALVEPAIAQAVGIQGGAGTDARELLMRHLEDRHLLLVLDNVEQVVDAAPSLARLLAACLRLKILVTSRIALRVGGEHLYRVSPLPVSTLGDGSGATASEIGEAPATRLFVQQAQAVRPGFVLTPDTIGAVADICDRLDGIPLAIELAAAWVRILSPQAILDHLDNRLPMLTGGGRDRPERLQTMRAAIEWSYDRLPPEEQLVFRRLAVFSGGCGLDAAATVVDHAAATGSAGLGVQATGDMRLLDRLATLVDHSLLVTTEGPGGESRFSMLETIREFGLERLTETGEAEVVRTAHAHCFQAVASAARQGFEGPQRRASHDRLHHDLDNLRAALAWFCETGDAECALQLASDLARFWTNSGSIAEGRAWMERVLALNAEASAQTRFDAQYWAAVLALLRQEFDDAYLLAREALAVARAAGNDLGRGMALVQLGEITRHIDPDSSEPLIRRGLAVFERLDIPFRTATAYRQLGELAYRQGDFNEAMGFHTAALKIWMELDHPWGVPISLRSLGDAALASGDLLNAGAWYRQSLERWRELGERLHISDCLTGLARVAIASGEEELAVVLLSGQARLDGEMGYVHDRDLSASLVEQARNVTGVGRFDALWERGQVRSLDAVLDDAMPPPH